VGVPGALWPPCRCCDLKTDYWIVTGSALGTGTVKVKAGDQALASSGTGSVHEIGMGMAGNQELASSGSGTGPAHEIGTDKAGGQGLASSGTGSALGIGTAKAGGQAPGGSGIGIGLDKAGG
jgi:hypothetical protein